MARLQFDQVWKRYPDGTEAVKDLSLEIDDGEFVILVGPSGCGKSTALRMVAGLEEISEGKMIIGDKVVNNMTPKERDIAMVFQSYALYPHMSVAENMGFALKLSKVSKDEIRKRVEEAAKILGLTEYLDRKPKALSGGQRQRVALGRAIVREPAFFLRDEPLSNLDAKLRVQTRAEISKLHKNLDTTFIYVTHDQVEALTMADRICVLRDGILQQLDTPKNLYDHPRNVFVAGFIGSPSMNFFDATVTGTRDEMYIDTGGFRLRVPSKYTPRLNNYLGKKVVFGVRPEDIHSAQYVPAGVTGEAVTANVEVSELMGNEIILYLEANGRSFVSRVDPRARTASGEQVQVLINMDNIHVFDPQSEEAIVT
jgi:multiple sugar transport system ATP-binding protein